MAVIVLSAAVGWGVLKAQVNEMRTDIAEMNQRGTIGLQATNCRIQEQLEELKRQSAVIHTEIRGIREILDLKTSAAYLREQRRRH